MASLQSGKGYADVLWPLAVQALTEWYLLGIVCVPANPPSLALRAVLRLGASHRQVIDNFLHSTRLFCKPPALLQNRQHYFLSDPAVANTTFFPSPP